MAWLKDPEGEGHPKIGLTYRLLRKLNRSLMSTWFRELDIVDNENMPHEGGIMFVAWHPSGLIDPVLLHASLPGKLSILAKHTLFNLPILGRLFSAAGALPIYRTVDSDDPEETKKNNAIMLENVGNEISKGGRLLLFPEGKTHSESNVHRAKTGAARIMLMALRNAELNGHAKPNLIPCLLYTSPSPRDMRRSRMPSSA